MVKHPLVPETETFILVNSTTKTLRYILPKINVDEIYKAMNSNEYINLLLLTQDQELLGDLMLIDKHYELPEFIKSIVKDKSENSKKIADLLKKRQDLVSQYNQKQVELKNIMEDVFENYEEHIKLITK